MSLSIVIALAGNKVDLVRSSTDGESAPAKKAKTTKAAITEDGDADDATTTEATTEEQDAGNATDEDEADLEDDEVPASEGRRQVSRAEAEEYAKESGLLFFETSAKTGEGVVEVFTEIGE